MAYRSFRTVLSLIGCIVWFGLAVADFSAGTEPFGDPTKLGQDLADWERQMATKTDKDGNPWPRDPAERERIERELQQKIDAAQREMGPNGQVFDEQGRKTMRRAYLEGQRHYLEADLEAAKKAGDKRAERRVQRLLDENRAELDRLGPAPAPRAGASADTSQPTTSELARSPSYAVPIKGTAKLGSGQAIPRNAIMIATGAVLMEQERPEERLNATGGGVWFDGDDEPPPTTAVSTDGTFSFTYTLNYFRNASVEYGLSLGYGYDYARTTFPVERGVAPSPVDVTINDQPSQLVGLRDGANGRWLIDGFRETTPFAREDATLWQAGFGTVGSVQRFQIAPQWFAAYQQFAGKAIAYTEHNAGTVTAPAPSLRPSAWPNRPARALPHGTLPLPMRQP